MAKPQPVSVRDFSVDWSAAQDAPVQAVNVFAAQATNQFHVLNLGFAAPPLIIDEADMQRVSKLERVPAQIVARILLTPADMRKLAKILSDNVELQRKLLGEGDPQ